MNTDKSFDRIALLALPKIAAGASPEKGLLSWSRPYLIEQVRKSGVDVVVTRGLGSLDAEGGLAKSVSRPEYAGSQVKLHQLGDVALCSLDVMRTIVKSVDVDHLVPVLNPTALRTHARNKNQAAADLLRPAGAYDRQFTLVNPEVMSLEQLDSLPGTQFVAKPNVGRMSNKVKVGDRQAIAEYVATQEDPFLVEEKLDFTAPFPGIKGLDEAQQARLDEANRDGVNKELRMYYFGNDTWDSVVRVAKPGETDFQNDNWLYIDQDSIPDEVYLKSAAVIEEVRKRIGTDEVNVALDYVFASSASEPEPHWEVMELNVAEPQLIQEHEHMAISRRQHTKLATQIARIAVS